MSNPMSRFVKSAQRMVQVIVVMCLISGGLCAAGQEPRPPEERGSRQPPETPRKVLVDASRGVDARVDYESLLRFGPWDDRNYQLTLDDLALLSPMEASLDVPLPVFFRVVLRRELQLPTEGVWQYPMSAPEIFRLRFGGFQVDERYIYSLRREEGVLRLDLEAAEAEALQQVTGDTVRVSSPVGSAESAVAIRPGDSRRVIAASNGPDFSAVLTHLSTDGGKTWQPTDLPMDATSADPTVAWSSDGAKAYLAALAGCQTTGGCELHVYRSGDGGVTWGDLQQDTPGDPRREFPDPADKEYLHVDVHPDSPFLDRIYMVWWAFGGGMRVARSADFANTWTALTVDGAVGIGADLTSDRLGRLFLLWHDPNLRQVFAARSVDGGASFEAPVAVASNNAAFRFDLPAQGLRGVGLLMSVDSDTSGGPFGNSIYAAWSDTIDPVTEGQEGTDHGRIVVARSRDGGQTWQESIPHPTQDSASVDRFNPWLDVDGAGNVHVTFYSTLRDPNRTSVDLMRVLSLDGGMTWSAPQRLTEVASPSPQDSFQFGDYNGLAVLGGRAVATFTDNRDEDGGNGDSVDIYAAGFTVVEPLFGDGFESGDTAMWSAAVP